MEGWLIYFITGLGNWSCLGQRSSEIEKLVCVAQSLACQCHLSFWETLSPASCEDALYIPCALTFVLVGRPCLTVDLSQTVDYEHGGGGQVTDWHLQAFGEWLAYLFPREPERLWGHCVGQREWTQCGSLCSLLNINVLLVLLLFFLLDVLRCVAYSAGSSSWDLVHGRLISGEWKSVTSWLGAAL